MALVSERDVARFWRGCSPSDGCWEWSGFKTNGYGRVTIGSKKGYAHRLSLLVHGVEIPESMEVDHLCRNRSCCNPSHLQVVSRAENVARATPYKLKNQCSEGHDLGGVNLMVLRSGKRRCRTCANARNRKFRARRVAGYVAGSR